jgi:hypothetical protein
MTQRPFHRPAADKAGSVRLHRIDDRFGELGAAIFFVRIGSELNDKLV